MEVAANQVSLGNYISIHIGHSKQKCVGGSSEVHGFQLQEALSRHKGYTYTEIFGATGMLKASVLDFVKDFVRVKLLLRINQIIFNISVAL
jgi:hypothetical protein